MRALALVGLAVAAGAVGLLAARGREEDPLAPPTPGAAPSRELVGEDGFPALTIAEADLIRAKVKADEIDPPPAPPAVLGDVRGMPVGFLQAFTDVMKRMKARGFEPLLHEGARSALRQRYLYARGTSNDPGPDAPHVERIAVDIVDGSRLHGHRVMWGATGESWGLTEEQALERRRQAERFFAALTEEADAQPGILSGAHFRSLYDPAHLEWRPETVT